MGFQVGKEKTHLQGAAILCALLIIFEGNGQIS
jgi:hypothetical protein